MKSKFSVICAGVCALAMLAISAAPVRAQGDMMKEKPPMYSYVGFWNIPRAQWAAMEAADAADHKILDKALADGTLVGYGHDMNLVHQPDGATHDQWWSAMSMAGVMNVLDQFYKSGSPTSAVLESATKHWDGIYVSRHYNWRAGSYKGAYSRASMYQLKADAPNDAVETLSDNLLVPLMEKLLADGSILEYEIDTEAIHTQAPGTFWIVYVTPNAEGLDKFDAALRDAHKMNPIGGPAFVSMVDSPAHRDYLNISSGTYK
jgi:hypothetical protein